MKQRIRSYVPAGTRRPLAVAGSLCLLLGTLSVSPAMAQGDSELDTPMKKFSYALGMRFGAQVREQIMQQGLRDIEPDAFAIGVRDILSGLDSRVTEEELREAFAAIRTKMQEDLAARAQESLERGQAFLAENKNAEGVVALDSGLQYRIVQEGTGPKPGPGDEVQAHYTGKLLNGEEFDSSVARGEPVRLHVAQVIPGWQEALVMMPAGSIWELWIPSNLAYGEQGSPPTIGPNETLYFRIELLEVFAE